VTYRTPIQVRFSDTDALGHLNNTAYALYAEQARVDLFRDLEQRGNLILAHIALDFRRQVHFGDTVEVATWVEGVGSSSVKLYQEIEANGQVAAEVRSVVVMFDFGAQRSVPVPEHLRAALLRFERASAAPA
jgi:acyl-CoA thioester hydrolase